MRLHYLSLALLLAGLSACSGSQNAIETSSPNPAGRVAASTIAVDMPVLVGRNIDQLRRSLGAPNEARSQQVGQDPTAEQMKATRGEDWVNTFERNGSTVVATFNARTRKVRDLVLIGSDEDQLLRTGNLSLTSADYMVLPVSNPQNNNQIMGVRVVARK